MNPEISDQEVQAILIGLELEKRSAQEAPSELHEIEEEKRVIQQVGRIKSELAHALQENSLWETIQQNRIQTKLKKEKEMTLWARIKKALGFN